MVEAADALQLDQERALRQVALSHGAMATAVAQDEAAVALKRAAQTSFDGAADAYRHDVGSLPDASSAETALSAASSAVATSHVRVLSSAAALAFATGRLTSWAALPDQPPHSPEQRQ